MKNLTAFLLVALVATAAVGDPPNNDTCAEASYLIDQGFTSFDVDLCRFANDYDLVNSSTCVDMPLPGPDAVWRATLETGEPVRLVATAANGLLVAMYMVTDCDDVGGSCVAASVDEEGNQVLEFVVEAPDLYFLIVDSAEGCGMVHVEMGGVLATETATWSSVKSLYH